MDREAAEKLVGDFGEAVLNRKTGIEPFMDVVKARNALIEALTAQPPPPETKGEAGLEVIEKLWLGYTEKVFWKPKVLWDLASANAWKENAPVNYGKVFIRQYNLSHRTLRNPLIGGELPKAKECPGIVSKDLAGWTCTYDKNGVCLTCGGQRGYESK